MTKNSLTIKKQTDRIEEENLEQEYDKFNIIDENNDRYNDEKDEEFIVKMVLKPTHKNGIDYVKKPQNSRVQKILKGSKRDLKNKNSDDMETLTQMVRKKQLNTARSVNTDGENVSVLSWVSFFATQKL